jgi:hypothetical protein
MKKKLEGKKKTQTLAARTLDNVGQTKKPMEPQGPAIDETVREYQTDCRGWKQGTNSRYAPTAHTSNEVTMTVLDPMPSTGKEANQSNAVSGGVVIAVVVDK